MPENPATGKPDTYCYYLIIQKWNERWDLTCTLIILLEDKLQVLQVLDRLKMKLQEKGDTSQNEKLSVFCETLRSPLFNQILTLQQSIKQLKGQVSHASGFMLMGSNQQGKVLVGDKDKLSLKAFSAARCY